MLFNTVEFALFLPIAFGLYWLLDGPSPKRQNGLLLIASYLFYGWWDWRFLSLIVLSSAIDFTVGLALASSDRTDVRRTLLSISLATNLGILAYFKYANFFLDSLDSALTQMGLPATGLALSLVLPVGISFYTFQTLSYTIDVYRRQITPTRDALAFFAYVSFFPQLVAGPIERAKRLLPQFLSRRQLSRERAQDGLRQILWGLVKKAVIADNLAPSVDATFANWADADATTLVLAAIAFAIQIYCDFSGYSDIALGSARLFGIDLMRNFAFPYFARDIAEFWRRWHISLSTWFRDYVYIPLGGSRASQARTSLNVMITFMISGLWHGANWTFVVWGLLHGLFFLPLRSQGRTHRHTDTAGQGRSIPGFSELAHMVMTFALVTIGWIFFRAPTLGDALGYLGGIATGIATGAWHLPRPDTMFFLAGAMLMVEWLARERQHGLAIDHLPRTTRWTIYYLLLGLIFWYARSTDVPFIYFQF